MTIVLNGDAAEAEVHAIGISFGNSNSSVAYTNSVRVEPSCNERLWKILLTGLSNRKERQK